MSAEGGKGAGEIGVFDGGIGEVVGCGCWLGRGKGVESGGFARVADGILTGDVCAVCETYRDMVGEVRDDGGKDGGFGFKKLEVQNQAFLMKLGCFAL